MNIFKKAAAVLSAVPILLLASCASSQENAGDSIRLNSREDGSGTRSAFVELFGIDAKDESGKKMDLTADFSEITNSTSVMMSKIAGDKSAIGYISLGSLNSSVKALKIDGADASAESIKNGSYKISRKFNIVAKDSVNETAADFMKFILSAQGQEVVEAAGYVSVGEFEDFQSAKPSGKIVISGSSSVSPVMEILRENYLKINPNAEINLETSDSSSGINNAVEGVCDLGMSSRELKEAEIEKGLSSTPIALDGVVVIVNLENPIDELASRQVKEIFTGEVNKWSQL